MFKKPSFIVLFLLAVGLLMTYQNCAQVQEEGGLFSQNCNESQCGANPDGLLVAVDLNLVPGGTFKISTNPESGFTNLRLTGSCKDGGFEKTLIKVKIYECATSGSSCNTLKYINSSVCQMNTNFEMAGTVGTLTPGAHKLHVEIVGIDKFGQEIYGPRSKATPISVDARETIRPPTLSSFSGVNFWADNKVYYFPSESERISLDGYITGFCDYNAAATEISIKLAFRGSSTYTPIAVPTQCRPVAQNANALNSPHRGTRTGYFQFDSLPIYMRYNNGTFVTCESGDYNCLNNPMNSMTNRLVALALFQRDVSFNYDVFSVRNLILHFKDERHGKGWLVEPLVEILKRVKKALNFSNDPVTGNLDGMGSSVNDFSQAARILSSVEEFYDPLVTVGDQRYGFGTRSFMVQQILGATENIAPAIYPAATNNYPGTTGNIYFLGGAATIPYRSIANGTLCGIYTSMADPIMGVVGLENDVAIERIALCLIHRFLNGLYDVPYEATYKLVQNGVVFRDNNVRCSFQDGGDIGDKHCASLLYFLNAAIKMKARHIQGVQLVNASDSQLMYFGNGLTQFYINVIIEHLAYRNNIDYINENEIFYDVFRKVYPELLDGNLRQTAYPTEFNFDGSTSSFGATRRIPRPAGSYTYPNGN